MFFMCIIIIRRKINKKLRYTQTILSKKNKKDWLSQYGLLDWAGCLCC